MSIKTSSLHRRSARVRLGALLAGTLLASCHAPSDDTPKERPKPLAADAPLLLLEPPPGLFAPEEEGVRLEDLSARDADVASLLFSLFEGGDVNLLVADDVRGSLSFDFRRTTLEEGFLSLLDLAGLTFRRDGDFLVVTGTDSKTIDVDYPLPLDLQGGEGTTATAPDLWELLEQNLPDLLEDEDRAGRVIVNALAGKVVLSGSPRGIRRAEAFLREVQESVDRQVIVETEVFEVTLSNEFRLGVSYSFFPEFLNSTRTGLLADGAALSQSASAGGTALRFGILKRDAYSVLVDMLQQMGETRILSAPRVSALNNRPARISVSEQVPYIERTIIDTDSTTRQQFDVEFEDAGVVVELVPQIGDDGEIVVQLSPSITEVTEFITTPDGLQTQPVLNVRETTTTLKVRDGQSIVLGGLRSVRRNESVTGIPFLMDIPLLGALFRSTIQTEKETELVIVMTPRLLTPERIRELVGIERERMAHHPGRFHFGRWMSPGDREPRMGGLIEQIARDDEPGPQPPTVIPRPSGAAGPEPEAGLSRARLARSLLHRAQRAQVNGDDLAARRAIAAARELDALEGWVELQDGLVEFGDGNLEAAREHFRRAVALNEDEPSFLSNLAVLAARTERPDLALRTMERAVQLSPDDAILRCNLGGIYEGLGRRDDALEQYKTALRARPDLPEALARIEWLSKQEEVER
ncbi:MAG: tetratricopeptide repeat protein [Planctomycetota bacterium]